MVSGPYEVFVDQKAESGDAQRRPREYEQKIDLGLKQGPKSRVSTAKNNSKAPKIQAAYGIEKHPKMWYDLPPSWAESENAMLQSTQASQPRNMIHYNGHINKLMTKKRHAFPEPCISPLFAAHHWQWAPMQQGEYANSWWPTLETSDQPPQRLQVYSQQRKAEDAGGDGNAAWNHDSLATARTRPPSANSIRRADGEVFGRELPLAAATTGHTQKPHANQGEARRRSLPTPLPLAASQPPAVSAFERPELAGLAVPGDADSVRPALEDVAPSAQLVNGGQAVGGLREGRGRNLAKDRRLLQGLLAAERRMQTRQPRPVGATGEGLAREPGVGRDDDGQHRLSATMVGAGPDTRPNSTKRLGGTPRLSLLGGASNLDTSQALLSHPAPETRRVPEGLWERPVSNQLASRPKPGPTSSAGSRPSTAATRLHLSPNPQADSLRPAAAGQRPPLRLRTPSYASDSPRAAASFPRGGGGVGGRLCRSLENSPREGAGLRPLSGAVRPLTGAARPGTARPLLGASGGGGGGGGRQAGGGLMELLATQVSRQAEQLERMQLQLDRLGLSSSRSRG